jgi:hypothetical protein
MAMTFMKRRYHDGGVFGFKEEEGTVVEVDSRGRLSCRGGTRVVYK